MSVLVKGMEMPKEGEYRMTLYVCSDGQAYVDVESFPVDEDRFDVVPVPAPHGRLIDADALKCVTIKTLEALKKHPKMDRQEMHLIAAFGTLGSMIDAAPTIIPADNDTAMEVKQNG